MMRHPGCIDKSIDSVQVHYYWLSEYFKLQPLFLYCGTETLQKLGITRQCSQPGRAHPIELLVLCGNAVSCVCVMRMYRELGFDPRGSCLCCGKMRNLSCIQCGNARGICNSLNIIYILNIACTKQQVNKLVTKENCIYKNVIA